MLIVHSLQQCDLLSVMRMELSLVVVEESLCLSEELFQNHVEVEAHEDWKEDSNQLRFVLVEALIDEYLQLREALDVIVWITARVHILILGGLRCVLSFTKERLIVLHKGLQVLDGELLHVATLCQVVGTLVLPALQHNIN